MKKLQTLIAAFLLSIFSATSAMSEYAVGVTGAYALLDASGTETEGGEQTSTDIDHNFGLASIFAEYTMGSITMGLDYIPFAADVSENVKTRTDVETSVTSTATETTTSRSQKAQAEIDQHINKYNLPTAVSGELICLWYSQEIYAEKRIDIMPGAFAEYFHRWGELISITTGFRADYYNKTDEVQGLFEDGWFRTGDMASFDKDGYLHIVDRKKDMIITGGENVYSKEVEDVLIQHPEVNEVAVIGLPDEHWGERVVAVIVCEGKVIEDTLHQHCQSYLGKYKIPREWFFVDEIPKSALGKTLKNKLRELIRV